MEEGISRRSFPGNSRPQAGEDILYYPFQVIEVHFRSRPVPAEVVVPMNCPPMVERLIRQLAGRGDKHPPHFEDGDRLPSGLAFGRLFQQTGQQGGTA